MRPIARLFAAALVLLALAAQADAQVAAAASAEDTADSEVQAYAYFSLTIAAIAQGDESTAQQAATIGMAAAIAAVAGASDESAVLLGIYASLEGFLTEGTLVYQGGEFDSDGVWLTDSSGESYFATYAELGALVDLALAPTPIIFDSSVFDQGGAWEDYGPGEQPGSSGGEGEASAAITGFGEGDAIGPRNRLDYSEDY